MAALDKFSSKAPNVAAPLREIFEICSSLDFDMIAHWKPREELAVEDPLSRVSDPSDWGSASTARAFIINFFGQPSVDLFASDL